MRSSILASILSVLLIPGAYAQTPDIRTLFVGSASVESTTVFDFGKEHRPLELREFYTRNNFLPAWDNERDARELITTIRTIYLDGLDPKNYHLAYLEGRTNRIGREHERAMLDIAMTDAFLELAHDLYEGRLDPAVLFPGEWEACTTTADYPGLLLNALNGAGICETLDMMKPMDNSYEGLKYMLNNFREIQSSGDFPPIKVGVDIKPGDADDRMPDILKRLSMLQLIPRELENESTKYDSLIIYAVQKFQRMHGLTADGVIGRRTQQAMNLRAEDYVETIIANLEKYRWHQSLLLERSVKINIPSCEVVLSQNESIELQMKAIVGRTDRKTPVLSSVITMVTINPTWTVPPTILKEDVLPAVKADSGYLKRHEMRVFTRNEKQIDGDSVNWSAISINNFPYTLRQDAGPRNPLGLIKFVFPNNHTVYLHDTNTPSLFSSQDRWLSSGCIRIQSPMALLRKLMEGTAWTEELVRNEIKRGETKIILLNNPIPIHIVYFTAFVNHGEFHIERDHYGYDRIILKGLAGSETQLFK
jgi:murein L,D-transpeptidase YcbB/YkuD